MSSISMGTKAERFRRASVSYASRSIVMVLTAMQSAQSRADPEVVIHADTSYLIDLLGEQSRGKSGKASAFLEEHAADHLVASVFVVCELEAGAAHATSSDGEQARLRALFQVLTVVYPDERFAPVYADALVTMQRVRKTVDTMDLLIAAGAVVDGAALVTANHRHFDVIPGLRVLGYRDAAR